MTDLLTNCYSVKFYKIINLIYYYGRKILLFLQLLCSAKCVMHKYNFSSETFKRHYAIGKFYCCVIFKSQSIKKNPFSRKLLM